MTRVLLIGQIPETVDFSNPALPPGMTAQQVHDGLTRAKQQMVDRGWSVDHCLVSPDATAGQAVVAQLAQGPYDCVVIGAGLRVPPPTLLLFEQILNAVHRHAPGATIAFNTRPDDSADAAGRWLP
jgi:hypothetical protein